MAIYRAMPFPDPSIVPPADRLSPTTGTVFIVIFVLALFAWAVSLAVRFARREANPADKPGIGGVVAFVLVSLFSLFIAGDVVALRLLGTEGSAVVTSADGYRIESRMRGSRVARSTSYVFVEMRDEATGVTCSDTTTPAAMTALEADPAMRMPFVHFAGLCQVGTDPSLSRAGAGTLSMILLLGLMLAWPKKRPQ